MPGTVRARVTRTALEEVFKECADACMKKEFCQPLNKVKAEDLVEVSAAID